MLLLSRSVVINVRPCTYMYQSKLPHWISQQETHMRSIVYATMLKSMEIEAWKIVCKEELMSKNKVRNYN